MFSQIKENLCDVQATDMTHPPVSFLSTNESHVGKYNELYSKDI